MPQLQAPKKPGWQEIAKDYMAADKDALGGAKCFP
jgi:hypothetical protein